MSYIKKIFVSAFIVLNFLAMFRTHVPLDTSRFFSTLYKPVDTYLSFFSIYQDWMMFAPNPTKLNLILTAEIEFEDGTRDTYHFPDSGKMNFVGKYSGGEKYRKIVTEGIRKDSNQWMWKDVAKFALRKVGERNLDKIPLRVHLTRRWADTPSLTERFVTHAEQFTHTQSHTFFTYEVI